MAGDTPVERWSAGPTGGIVDVFASVTMAAEFGVNVGSAIVNSSLFKAPTHSNPYEPRPSHRTSQLGLGMSNARTVMIISRFASVGLPKT
jgi:hypothetical protein